MPNSDACYAQFGCVLYPIQVELDKQSAVIRDLNEKLKRASAVPKLTQVRVKRVLTMCYFGFWAASAFGIAR